MHVGIVGGVERNEAIYQRLALRAGHTLEFHSGHLAGRGSTTLELVTSGRSVSIGLSFCGHCSAAAGEAAKAERDSPINAAMPGIAFNKISH